MHDLAHAVLAVSLRQPLRRELMGDVSSFFRSAERVRFLALGFLVATGLLFTWWAIGRADRDLRESVLNQARIMAGAVDVERLKTLSGTGTDLASPDYRRLKEQLAAVRESNPMVRFVYLMGRKSGGTVFLFADSEPSGSRDESLPGQIFDEASETGWRAFGIRKGQVLGPLMKKGGTWVTA